MVTLCQHELLALLRKAEAEGAQAAMSQFELDHADRQDQEREGRIDALKALDEDPTGQDREGMYIAGCGEYDTVDYRGRPLKPLVNDAGEWLGM